MPVIITKCKRGGQRNSYASLIRRCYWGGAHKPTNIYFYLSEISNSSTEQSSFIHLLSTHHVTLLICKTVNSIAQCKKNIYLGQLTEDAKRRQLPRENLLKRILLSAQILIGKQIWSSRTPPHTPPRPPP